jgi:hypothetical protein
MVASYPGYIWWDNETDGEHMNPQRRSALFELARESGRHGRTGLWGDLRFLEKIGTTEFNAQLKQTQFVDFHGHGWLYARSTSPIARATCSTRRATSFRPTTRTNSRTPSIFAIFILKKTCTARTATSQDNHGNGNLHGET